MAFRNPCLDRPRLDRAAQRHADGEHEQVRRVGEPEVVELVLAEEEHEVEHGDGGAARLVEAGRLQLGDILKLVDPKSWRPYGVESARPSLCDTRVESH